MTGSNPTKAPERRKLAARCYWKHGAWYFVSRENQWIRLGVAEHEALQKLAELTVGARNMLDVFLRYRRELLVNKKSATREQQSKQMVALEKTFGRMQPRKIRPVDVATFHDALGEARGHVTANRHLALMSHVCKMAVRWGDLDLNPCHKLGRHKETPRTRYVTDDELAAVYPHAEPWLQILIDLARITGQREGNLIRLNDGQVDDVAGVTFPGQKRGRSLIVQWSDEFSAVIERARMYRRELTAARAAKGRVVCSLTLVVNSRGQPVTVSGLQSALRRMWAAYAKANADKPKDSLVEHFTFHDLRAKAGSENPDERLLGHVDSRTFRRVYQRKPVAVRPVK